MEINFSRPSATDHSRQSSASDLLQQLQAAGTIKAEVIKLLPGQLLLHSRLGEILTSGRLDLKLGDQVQLRLDQTKETPILKVSRVSQSPVKIELPLSPSLAAAVALNRPSLAVVAQVHAQTIELQLAHQNLVIPRVVKLARNQWVSLFRHEARDFVEIRPLQKKSVLLAVLKRLLPQQSLKDPQALVKFYNLLLKRPPAIQLTALGGKLDQSSKPQSESSGRNRSTADRAVQVPSKNSTPNSPASTIVAKTLNSGLGSSLRLLAEPKTNPAKEGVIQQANKSGVEPVSKSPQNQAHVQIQKQNQNQASRLGYATGAIGSVSSASPASSGKQASNNSELNQNLPSKRPAGRDHSEPALIKDVKVLSNSIQLKTKVGQSSGSKNQGSSTHLPSQNVLATTKSKNEIPLAAANQADSKSPNSINHLGKSQQSILSGFLGQFLRLLPQPGSIDDSTVRHWLIGTRESDSKASAPLPAQLTWQQASRPTNILQMLRLFANESNLLNELQQLLKLKIEITPEQSSAPKTQAHEALLNLVRESSLLAEQILSQHLLRQVSAGLQQETQQPLTLSFSLPFVDADKAKSIEIDLSQDDQNDNEADQHWEIRIRFDFSGLGPIDCHITLQSVDVAASFYAENAQTERSISAELPALRKQLRRAGFNPGELQSFVGKLRREEPHRALRFSDSLVDIEV